MSAASRTIRTTTDLRPIGAAIGGLVLAGAILAGLAGAQAAAPRAGAAPDTAPFADHGWSSASAPLAAPVADHGWSSAASSVAGSGSFGFSKAANVAK